MTDVKALSEYAQLALHGLGLDSLWPIIQPGYGQIEAMRLIARVTDPLVREDLRFAEGVLREPKSLYQASRPEKISPSDELTVLRRTYACILGTIMGDENALLQLGSLLVTEPVNSKLVISRFLSLLTDGEIGASKGAIPHKAQVLQWVDAISERRVKLAVSWELLAQANAARPV